MFHFLFSSSLRDELTALQHKCSRVQMRLHRYQAAHQFLERCVESNNEFHEVRDLIMRNDTLVANHQVCSSSSDPRPALRSPIVCVVFTVYHPLGNSLGAHRVRYSEPAADQRPEAGAQEVRRGVFAYCFESLRGTMIQ